MKYCTQCGTPTEDDNQLVCTQCGHSFYNDAPAYMPMAWFKFLIYFSLFAGAVLNALSGIFLLTGITYKMSGFSAGQFYDMYGAGYIALGIIYGFFCIGFAAYQIVVRTKLAAYKKSGPKMLINMYFIGSATGILYTVAEFLIVSSQYNIFTVLDPASLGTAIGSFIGSIIGSIISCVVFVICNSIYFKKRAHLFTN